VGVFLALLAGRDNLHVDRCGLGEGDGAFFMPQSAIDLIFAVCVKWCRFMQQNVSRY